MREFTLNTESSPIHSKGIELKPLVNTLNTEQTAPRSHSIPTDTNTYNNTPTTHDITCYTTTSPTSHTGHNEFGSPGSSSQIQVAVNIFISFVGSGMLGMPYAFKQSGWVLGCICLCCISSLNVYAMLLLIQTRKKLESNGFKDIHGYGCVGRVVSGERGERMVNTCLVISQIGFSTAYIIFIAANVNNIWGIHRAYVCFGCVPILAILVQLQDMKHLSPFSLLADVSNLAGLVAVLVQDWKAYESYHELTIEFDFHNILYVSSVALYCMYIAFLCIYLWMFCVCVCMCVSHSAYIPLCFVSQHWRVLEWFSHLNHHAWTGHGFHLCSKSQSLLLPCSCVFLVSESICRVNGPIILLEYDYDCQ